MLSVTMAGLNAAQKEMNVTSNNLANASTVGFKRSYANFGDVFSSDPAANPKTSVGSGVLTSSIARDTTAGALKTTGRVTDMAIDVYTQVSDCPIALGLKVTLQSSHQER